MVKYAFMNFPSVGQINPTLAIVEELVERGQEVVYFLPESFRALIERTGASFHPIEPSVYAHLRGQPAPATAADDNRRLAGLPLRMLKASRQVLPSLLARMEEERPDCLIYSGLFLWARMMTYALDIPGVALWPTYAPTERFSRVVRADLLASLALPESSPTLASRTPQEARAALRDELAYLRERYRLPFPSITSLVRGEESLVVVFLPREFQPDADSFDDRYVFVGPSFRPDRDRARSSVGYDLQSLLAEVAEDRPCLYISRGTIYTHQAEFYNACISAFGDSEWRVILALGNHLDPASLNRLPANFLAAPSFPQLEILPGTDVFLSHGGMNSVMESLYFGVPLIVVPHIHEQQVTAERLSELGLGISIDQSAVTAETLAAAVDRVFREPAFSQRARQMGQQVREAGGYRAAVDAILASFRRSQERRQASPRVEVQDSPHSLDHRSTS
jgi:MGT family glycosyltransferase